MNLKNKIVKLSGDASFREFYRNKKKKSITVLAKKEKKKNLLIYDAINKLLIKNNILAPRLIKEVYKKNFMEIEDLGNQTIFDRIKKNKNIKKKYYKKIIFLLKKLQKIKKKYIITFSKTKYIIPEYSKKKILSESKLFLDWYIPKTIPKNKNKILKKKLSHIFIKLVNRLKIKRNVFVHRDFHVSNMMFYKKKIYLIDSQDALYGNIAYDLASLIDDVRVKTKSYEKKYIFDRYVKNNKDINVDKFKNDFEILSVLRNLKIIGIFTRLSVRDKKNKYLKLIPYAWNLIENRVDENRKFSELKIILDEHFTKKIRKRV